MTREQPSKIERKRRTEGYRYIYASFPLTTRIIRELRFAFARNPKYSKIVPFIRTTLALQQQPQYGILVRDVSGQYVPLSAQNFIGSLISYVFVAKTTNQDPRKPGIFIDWVKEDVENINKLVIDEVVDDSQITGMTGVVQAGVLPMINPRTGKSDDDSFFVRAKINNVPSRVLEVDFRTGRIVLDRIPSVGSKVELTYWNRDLVQPGFYILTLDKSDTEGTVKDILFIEEEIIVEEFDGSLLSFELENKDVLEDSEHLLRDNNIVMVRDKHYTIDYKNGLIAFEPTRVPIGSKVFAEYKFLEGTRDFKLSPGEFDNKILPGVVIAFNERNRKGDEMVVAVSDVRKDIAFVFGGRIDLSMSLRVYARDPAQREELYDLLPHILFGERKKALDEDGIVVKAPSLNGWGDEVYDVNTDSRYFTADVTIPFQTDWEIVEPVPVRIARIEFVEDNTVLDDSELDKEVQKLLVVEDIVKLTEPVTNIERVI